MLKFVWSSKLENKNTKLKIKKERKKERKMQMICKKMGI